MAFCESAKNVRLVVLDVDGTLTDGKIIIGPQGELCKHFHVRDGLGIKLLMNAGIDVAIITGRSSAIVSARMRELGVKDVIQGQTRKTEAFLALIQAKGLSPSQCACVGDDLPDLPLMQLAGCPCAPKDAVKEVIEASLFVSGKNGGEGAVRDIAEAILHAQGKWESVITHAFPIHQAPSDSRQKT